MSIDGEDLAMQALEVRRRVALVETELAQGQKPLADLNYIVYKLLYEMGAKQLLQKQEMAPGPQ
jgi:hypothetical protein